MAYLAQGSISTSPARTTVPNWKMAEVAIARAAMDHGFPKSVTESQGIQTVKRRLGVNPAPRAPEIKQFVVEIKYEGTVVCVNPEENTFTGRLLNLAGKEPEEEGEFSLDELNGDERFVVPGALFTFTIGLQMRGTTKLRVSDLRFRRIPAFTSAEIRRAEEKGQALSDFFAQHINNEPNASPAK
ncbi:MAG: hypothetical protein CFE43_18855 [Burkholderiales bacterium PBB3]|nr:MAG: hypothetical protein CFE43_18855 [Burkholderiales bacterium PBB3]